MDFNRKTYGHRNKILEMAPTPSLINIQEYIHMQIFFIPQV